MRGLVSRRALKRLIIAIITLGVLSGGAVYLFPRTFLLPVAERLVLSERPRAAEVLVILLGADGNTRPDTGAELYQRGFTRRILMVSSFRKKPWYGLRRAESYPIVPGGALYRDRLVGAGVASSDISLIESDGAYDTFSELSIVAEYLRSRGIRSVLFVTSASHTKRVSLIWHRIAPDLESTVIAAPDNTADEWWNHPGGRRTVAKECGAMLKEFIRRLFDIKDTHAIPK